MSYFDASYSGASESDIQVKCRKLKDGEHAALALKGTRKVSVLRIVN